LARPARGACGRGAPAAAAAARPRPPQRRARGAPAGRGARGAPAGRGARRERAAAPAGGPRRARLSGASKRAASATAARGAQAGATCLPYITPNPTLPYRAGGRDVFGGRSSSDKRGAAVAHLSVVPLAESARLCLMVVTADGRRVYLSTQAPAPSGFGAPPGGAPPRPSTLRAEFARPAPSAPSGASGDARCAPGRPGQTRAGGAAALCCDAICPLLSPGGVLVMCCRRRPASMRAT